MLEQLPNISAFPCPPLLKGYKSISQLCCVTGDNIKLYVFTAGFYFRGAKSEPVRVCVVMDVL